ncbi:MAG: NADH-quinone oxidoreductase subunit N [Fimbriimonadaceae bacterium]|nr:NADH-quinone oxidoreductase subunit N [Fimbriimonadaceae bacterium]
MSGFPWASLATETALLGLGLLLVTLDIVVTDKHRKHLLGYVALGGLLLCLLPAAGSCVGPDAPEELFGGLYRTDDFQRYFRLLSIVVSLLVGLLTLDYLEHIRIDRGVFFIILVFGTQAMILLAGANDLVLIYLSFEFLSIASYILVGFLLGKDKGAQNEVKRSTEASLKYLIYGAVASGVMLYGFSLFYGLAGSTSLPRIAEVYGQAGNEMIKVVALALVLVGMGFKVGAAPFHQWAPDVYEGAPTPIAAFLAVGSKGAALAVLTRFLVIGLGVSDFASPILDWRVMVAILAVLTMFVGNLLALLQANIKRLLGYSSVAHAGYLLAAVACNFAVTTGGAGAAVRLDGVQAMLIYLAAYLFMTVGAFAVVVWYQRNSGSELVEDYAGLAQRSPGMAVAMLIFMLSLTGIPPTAGFVGKLFILRATIAQGELWWLGLAIVLNSVISAFYYMNVVRVMFYLKPKAGVVLRPTFATPAVVGLCAAATILLLLQFGVLVELTAAPLGAILTN